MLRSQLLATAMYNMHQRQDRFDYLFTDKILDFIEAHPDILKPILGTYNHYSVALYLLLISVIVK